MAFYSRRDFVAAASAAAFSAKSFAQVQGAGERLKVGIIGRGGMAGAHLDGLLKTRDAMNIELAAVCDVFDKRRDNFAQRTGGTPYKNYKQILDDKTIDYVLIATPEHWHAQITLDALDAGKHVYVEKPMTHTIEEAKKVVAKQKQNPKLKLQVGVQGLREQPRRRRTRVGVHQRDPGFIARAFDSQYQHGMSVRAARNVEVNRRAEGVLRGPS